MKNNRSVIISLMLCAVLICTAGIAMTGCGEEGNSGETDQIDPLKIKAGDLVGDVSPSGEHDAYFQAYEIPDDIFKQMNGRSFKEDGEVSRDDLRYLRLLYVDYDGNTRMGEMVVNRKCAEDVVSIFKELYEQDYQINKMRLVDNYYYLAESDDPGNEADSQSIIDDNTSAFNYRTASNNPNVLSNHAFGYAIDVNPVENPYVEKDGTLDGPDASKTYLDRSKATVENHMLSDDDICVKTFKKYGFTWGGDWDGDKDYQHFECVEKTPEQ